MLTFKSAIIFFILGVLFMIKNPLHKCGFLRAQGIITDYEKSKENEKEIFFAKVKFPAKNDDILFTDTTARSKKPTFGKIVSVLYNSQDPGEAQIESNFSILFPWIFILIAFVILIYNLKQIFIL